MPCAEGAGIRSPNPPRLRGGSQGAAAALSRAQLRRGERGIAAQHIVGGQGFAALQLYHVEGERPAAAGAAEQPCAVLILRDDSTSLARDRRAIDSTAWARITLSCLPSQVV